MKAVAYSKFEQPLEIITVDDPQPDPDGVVLEVRSTGLCLSDWHGWMGHDPDISLPHIPGHEMAGVIIEVGKNITNWRPGDRVTLPFVCGCGHCMYCIEGNPQVCDHQFQPGFTHWGSFAPHVAIKYAENNLVAIPEYLDFSSAAVLGCRFATSFRALVDQGKLRAGQWVAVHGCGGVGLSAIMISKALKARIIAVDLHEPQLKLASELGAEYTINASKRSVSEQIIDLSGGGVQIGIDAVGKAGIVKTSIRSLRKGGRHIQIGLVDPEEKEIALPMDYIIARELGIIGSHGMQADRYSAIIEMIRKGLLKPGELVKNAISLKESVSALPKLNRNHKPGITVINDFIL